MFFSSAFFDTDSKSDVRFIRSPLVFELLGENLKNREKT